jgi:hypothetical protein
MGKQSINRQVDPTVFDRLLEPVAPFVEEQSQKLTPHHNEKYSFKQCVRLLIYYFVSDFKSIKLLLSMLRKGLIPPELNLEKVPPSTFSDALERFPSHLFKALFIGLLATVSLKALPELEILGKLYCVDGSLFPTLISMVWAEYKKNSQAIKVHLCFELNRMIPVDIIVGSGNSSERKALLKMVKAGATYIADRGYGAFYVYHEIISAHAHFVIRVKTNLRKVIIQSLNVELPEKVKLLFKDVTDQIIQYENDPYAHTYRLVCFRVGKEIFNVLTDRLELTTIQVITLYAYRWQIELIFRFLKRTINGLHLIKHCENGVTIQFYIMLIVALLQLKLKQDVMIQNEQRGKQCPPKVLENNTKTSPSMSLEAKESVSQPASNSQRELIDNKHASVSPMQREEDFNRQSDKPISNPYQFFEMIGEKLKKYWKIGIHWLTALRRILHLPFDARALVILDSR